MFKVDLEKRREEILYGNLFKSMIILAIPTIMMGIVQALIPLSDAWFATNLLGKDIFGAITFSQPSINVMIAISQGLGIVGMAIIGKAVGEGDIKKVKYLALQLFMLGLILGILLMPVCYFVSIIISNLAKETMRDNVLLYISLYSIVMPFYFMASIFNAIKNVTGNPESSFIRMIFLFILKLIFNTVYLKIFKFGIYGTIYSSFTAYLITGVWMYYDLFIKKSMYKFNIKEYKFDFKIVKEFIYFAIPSILSNMLINLGFLLINTEVVNYGVNVINAIGIANQINSICFILPTCIGTAVTTIVSLNIGVGQKEKAKKGYFLALKINLVISILMLCILLPFDRFFINFFTIDESVIKITREALSTYTYTIFPFGIFVISQAVLNALGRTEIPLFMGILRIWLIRYIFILITKKYLRYTSVFYGNLTSNIIAAIIIVIIVLKIEWKSIIKTK